MRLLSGSFKLDPLKLPASEREKEKLVKEQHQSLVINGALMVVAGVGIMLNHTNALHITDTISGASLAVFVVGSCIAQFKLFRMSGFANSPSDEYEMFQHSRANSAAYTFLATSLFVAVGFHDVSQSLSWPGILLMLTGISYLIQYKFLRKDG